MNDLAWNDLAWMSLAGPHISVRRFLIWQSKLSETCPRIRQISWSIDIPTVIDAAFLHKIQTRVCSSGDVNVLQWNGVWFFSRRVMFDSGSTWWRYMKFPDMDQKVMHRFTRILKWVLRWWRCRPFCFSKKISWTFSSNWVIPHQGGCSQFLISSSKFGSSICNWKYEFSIFVWEILLPLHWVFLSRFPMRPSFPTPQRLQPVRHPSKFSPRRERTQKTIQVRLSFQIDGFLTGLSQK